jgi:hypothetical protein
MTPKEPTMSRDHWHDTIPVPYKLEPGEKVDLTPHRDYDEPVRWEGWFLTAACVATSLVVLWAIFAR